MFFIKIATNSELESHHHRWSAVNSTGYSDGLADKR
jgi:hypothetical protein